MNEKKDLAEEFGLKKKSGFFANYGTRKEEVVDVEIRQLVPFKNHPFKVLEDESMTELKDSIKEHGVSVPIIVRTKERGIYEIVAGHRRSKACELLGIEKIPAFIRNLDDDEAVFQMVNTNIQREQLLPSEKAFAYKMKLEAMKRKAGRPKNNSGQVGENNSGQVGENNSGQVGESNSGQVGEKSSIDILGEQSEDSGRQIQRYIRLTELIPEFLSMVDTKKLPFNTSVELSYLSLTEQKVVLVNMEKQLIVPTYEQASKLKKYSKDGKLNETVVDSILTETKDVVKKTSFKLDTTKYFPKETSKAEMEDIIDKLLQQWKESQG